MSQKTRMDSFSRTILGILLSAACVLVLFVLFFSAVIQQFSDFTDRQRQSNLLQTVTLARNAIDPIILDVREGRLNVEKGRDEVRTQVRRMIYSDQYGKNYVFMSAYDGTMLVQPFEPEKEMTNQLDLRDVRGEYLIQKLIAKARSPEGCGFTSYYYFPPGSTQPERKESFVMGIPELQCYIGTGMYMQQAEKDQQRLLKLARALAVVLLLLLLIPILLLLRQLYSHNRELIREIITREKAEAAMREREETFRALSENSVDIIMRFDRNLRYVYVNPIVEQATGLPASQFIGKNHEELGFPPELVSLWETALRQVLDTGKTNRLEFQLPTGKWIDWLVMPELGSNGRVHAVISAARDITERKESEVERGLLQEQLLQAQKMEAVGRLAGGVAHDFNNILQAILGNLDLAQEETDPESLVGQCLAEARKAAERSVNLTRQLLAFARKQTAAPIVLNLNESVEGMLKMLRRLIGEDVTLAWVPDDNPWSVRIDPTQVDQILANLCVNARDAIDGVGRITIETAKATFDEDYCAEHSGAIPGEFIRLEVSDDGRGMDKDTVDKVFEPFFTTKGMGQGTGLGLAMVYGIVKQNDGFINVYSEPDKGTTFKIYLPRHLGEVSDIRETEVTEIPKGQGELILLVEDEMQLMNVAQAMLSKVGYTVLAANTPGEACRLAEEHAGRIQLLITDVIMPEINGRELAGRLQAAHPELRCLFMSGYTANVIATHGVLEKGVQFIQKPFSTKHLAIKVREVLDSAIA